MAVDQSVTFYTVCDDKYFPALVGLLNSLRLMGHDDPLVVGDCGLTATQRKLLAPHCTLFELSKDLVKNPQYYKPFPFLLKPHGTVVFIDTDMIVTKNLSAALTAAAEGKPAFEGYQGHGVFTWTILDALKNGDLNANGTIELSELVAYVQDKVPAIAAKLKGRGRAAIASRGTIGQRQSARFGSRGEDFALVGRIQ